MENRLKELRQAKGLAQQGLAVKAEVSPSLVVSVERWGYRPSERVRERIAAALGVEAEAIWPREADRVAV